MKSKKDARLKRAARTRCKIRRQDLPRLVIHKTPRHMYAQLTSADGSITFASASTLDNEVKSELKDKSGVAAASVVGKFIATRAAKNGHKNAAFDRSGFKYHGRVKALADAAREAGLTF